MELAYKIIHFVSRFFRSAKLKQVWLCSRLIETFIIILRWHKHARFTSFVWSRSYQNKGIKKEAAFIRQLLFYTGAAQI
jgi:hypothetical protein